MTVDEMDSLARSYRELESARLLLRRSAAVGDYILGRLDLATAAETAELSPDGLREAVCERAADRPDSGTAPELTIVVPVYNNAGTLHELHRRLTAVLDSAGCAEVVYVDDGSRDSSVEVLAELHARDQRVRVLRLSRNFGQQAALTAGLDVAAGRAVVMMDADLQDPPEVLPKLMECWRAGFEVVYAVRARRQEGRLKRACYRGFYRVYRYLAETDVPLDSGDFCLLDRRVVEVLRQMPERTRFLRGMRSWTGFRQTGVPYDRNVRGAGESQYSVRRLLRLAADGLVSFSNVPLRLAAFIGLLSSLLGLVLLFFVAVVVAVDASVPTGWASTLSVPLLIGGVQLTMLGVVGAYVARIYAEVKKRPMYVVQDTWD